MKISVIAIVLAAVAGISAAPVPNGQVWSNPSSTKMFHPRAFAARQHTSISSNFPQLTLRRPVEALETRASDAISGFMDFFRRDDSILPERRDRSPITGRRKKVAVRTVGRTVSLPRWTFEGIKATELSH